MVGKQFRLIRAVIAVQHRDGKSHCTTIPENALVVVDGLHDGERLLRVRWENEELLVFTQDLRERSAPLAVAEGRTLPVNN